MRTPVPLPVSTEEWPLMTFTPTGPLSIHRDPAGEIYVASSVSGKRDDTGNEWKFCLGKASVSPPKVLLIITLGPRRLWVSPVLLSHAHRVRQRLVCGGEEHACKKNKKHRLLPTQSLCFMCVFPWHAPCLLSSLFIFVPCWYITQVFVCVCARVSSYVYSPYVFLWR